MNIITFFRKYGYLKAVGFALAGTYLIVLSVYFAESLDDVPGILVQSIVTAAYLGVGFILLFLLCKAKASWFLSNWKFNGKQIVAIVILFLPFVVFLPLNQIVIQINPSGLISDLLHHFSIGFYEEILFRGVLLVAFFWLYAKSNIKNPVVAVLVFNGLFFGYYHLINLLVNDAPLWGTFLQCNGAGLMGLQWALFTIVTRNVWLPAISHFLYNRLGYHNLSEGFLGLDYQTSHDILRFGVPIVLIVVFAILYDKSTGQNWVSKLKERFGDS